MRQRFMRSARIHSFVQAAILLTCLLTLAVAVRAAEPAPAPATPAAKPAKAAKCVEPKSKVELFNGKDLTGWVSYLKNNTEAARVWSVSDGVLKCVGKPNGYLRTEQAYANYKLTVEWRFIKPGNTGVLVHINGAEKIWPLCVECQGMHATQGDMYFWSGAKTKELTKGPKVARKGADAEKPVGEWNTFQVVCVGDTITVLVNGQEMNKTTGGSLTGGQIGLQSEGAQLEVRHVTIEPAK